ncbi:MAG: YeeE/YedE thiosulfate transporter family protein [Bacteroidota bacterium]
MIDLLSQPWHWAVSGLAITGIMWILLYAGKQFGVSSNLRTMCSLAGAGRYSDFFRFDWKAQQWNLLFVIGAILGGYLASTFLASPEPVAISTATQSYLQSIGIHTPQTLAEGNGFVPQEIFATQSMFSPHALLLLIGGGFLVGFGTRYAGGCTSGHAISGLANLQLPSLIAVVGFFLGGLLMTWFILPYLLPVHPIAIP